uniref:Uncharacterized protein n=1 Tax=Arundo donax TaxID=35708 RepID=A0A0A9AZI1_ARUDO
MHSQADLSNN